MPIKQVMCCQCSNLVNKAITYSIEKDKRACRNHPGVIEKKNELELAKFVKTKNEIAKAKGKPELRSSVDLSAKICWLCANKERPISLIPTNKCHQALPFLREDFKPGVQITNNISICNKCCETLSIKVGTDTAVALTPAITVPT